jgi:hypothetical protein
MRSNDFSWWQRRTEVTGAENLLVRTKLGRKLHEWLYPDHPDYNGGDY